MTAAETGDQLEVIRVLLQGGADVNKRSSVLPSSSAWCHLVRTDITILL
jgi:hypothetical protein